MTGASWGTAGATGAQAPEDHSACKSGMTKINAATGAAQAAWRSSQGGLALRGVVHVVG